MPYDEHLAARLRRAAGDRPGVTEKKMFGGLALLLDGKMFAGVLGEDLVARVGPGGQARALARGHTRPMDFTGRPMKGYVYVGPGGTTTVAKVKAWVDEAALFVATLGAGEHAAPSTAFSGFPEATFRFLRGIHRHNDKAWFEAHRADFEAGYGEPAKAFVLAIGPRLRKIAPEVGFEAKVNGSLFRIHRDVRFSKDKSPYKDHLDLWFWLGDRRGWDTPGFFFRMFADRLLLGAGMHRFEKTALDAYRRAVVDPRAGRALAKAVAEVEKSGPFTIGGTARKTVPRGFDGSHERAAWLLHEGLWAEHAGPIPSEARGPDFVAWCADRWAATWPIARWIQGAVTRPGGGRA